MLCKTKEKKKKKYFSSLRACSLQILECSFQTHHVLEHLKETAQKSWLLQVCQPWSRDMHWDSQHSAILSTLKLNQEKGPETL